MAKKKAAEELCIHGETHCPRCALNELDHPITSEELAPEDVAVVLAALDPRLRTVFEPFRNKLVIAGGFIRSVLLQEPIKDIDLFTQDVEAAKELGRRLKGSKINVEDVGTINDRDRGINITFKAYEGVPPVQVVYGWPFTDTWSLLERFDFTITRAAIWPDAKGADGEIRWRGICDERYYRDISTRRLVYTKPVTEMPPGGSVLRMLKFIAKGYSIPMESLARCLADATFQLGPFQDTSEVGHYWTPEKIAAEWLHSLRSVLPDKDILRVTEPDIETILVDEKKAASAAAKKKREQEARSWGS